MKMPEKRTRMSRSTVTISDLLLEQYSLGELPARLARTVKDELARDANLRARLEALEDSNGEIMARYPAELIAPAIRERLLREGASGSASSPNARHSGPGETRERRRVPPLAWALPVAAVVVLALSFFVLQERVATGSETRLKGLAPHLTVFRKTASGAEELRGGTLAHRADVLQLSYTAGEAKYGVIFSVDGRGSITWHLPEGYRGGSRAAPALDAQGQVVLPSAYELDDAPGFERFFLVYSSVPFDVGDVERAARALLSRRAGADKDVLGLRGGLGQYSVLLKKQG
jgi:hypothetical protein